MSEQKLQKRRERQSRYMEKMKADSERYQKHLQKERERMRLWKNKINSDPEKRQKYLEDKKAYRKRKILEDPAFEKKRHEKLKNDPERWKKRIKYSVEWKKQLSPERKRAYKLIENHPRDYPLNNNCFFCGTTVKLEHGHLDYENDGHNYLTVCHKCNMRMETQKGEGTCQE